MIKGIKNLINTHFRLKYVLKTYSSYLHDGEYEMFISKKNAIFLRDDQNTKDFLNLNFNRNKKSSTNKLSRLKLKCKIFYSRLFRLTKYNNNKSIMHCSIAMINWDDDVKLFDLEKKLVVTFFSKKSKYNEYIKNIEYFSDYFNVTYLYKDCEKQMICEELIKEQDFKKRSVKEKFIKYIINQYIEYFNDVNPNLFLNTGNLIPDEIKGKWKSVYNGKEIELTNQNQIPLYYMHSDVHYDNVLIKENKPYFIDWEHSSNKPFFYDIFNIMFVEVINHNDLYLLNRYLDGVYDIELEELFNSVSFKYDSSNRLKYFLFFVQYRFINFDIINNNYSSVYRRYKKLFKILNDESIII